MIWKRNNYSDLTTVAEKTLFLGVLYFIQGFPYGFQDKLIPLLLIVKGHSPSTIGLIRLLLLPWLAKALFAPMIDMTLTINKWVTISLIGLMSVSLFNTLWPDSTIHNDDDYDNGRQISQQFITTLFLLNFFSAFQDIAVDAIAVKIYTKHSDIMTGNVAQVVGYKLGAFFGSGILFWIYSLFDWTGLFATLTLIYSIVLLMFNTYSNCLIMENNDNEKILDKNETKSISNTKTIMTMTNLNDSTTTTIKTKTRIFDQPQKQYIMLNTSTMVLYVFIYKLGESAALSTYPYFLISICGLSSHQMAFWNGTIGSIFSIMGSMLASRFSISILTKLIKFRLLPLFLQLVIIALYHLQQTHFDLINFSAISSSLSSISISSIVIYYASLVSILLLHLIGGLITTMTFTLMMMTCKKMPESFRATRFTLLSTTEVFGKLLFSSISGYIVESFGFLSAYITFLILSIIPCWVLSEDHFY